ncbi:MAG: S-layer homology domain-containing protein [Clostridiales bacterium]|nr:S-layer homology domain-containing protein [Clostridiales bacterium]
MKRVKNSIVLIMMICLLVVTIYPLDISYAENSNIITEPISVGNQNESGVGWSWVTHDEYNPNEPISDTNYSGIFTMDGLHVEYSGNKRYALDLPAGSKIILLNNNLINSHDPNVNIDNAYLQGINIEGDCEITGTGNLECNGDLESIGCNGYTLKIKDTNIKITKAGSISALDISGRTENGEAWYKEGKLIIENSNISIDNRQGFRLGALDSSNLVLYNSNINIIAKNYGIIERGKIYIDGGSINISVDNNGKETYAIMTNTVEGFATPSYGKNMVMRAKDGNGQYSESICWDNKNTEKDGFSYYRSVKTGKMVTDIKIWENPVKLSNTTIQGTVNQTVFNNVKMGIELTSDSFKGTDWVYGNYKEGTDWVYVNNWFTNLPTGINIYAVDISDDKKKCTISINGMPTEAKSEYLSMVIPADKLESGTQIDDIINEKVKWDIQYPQSTSNHKSKTSSGTVIKNINAIGTLDKLSNSEKQSIIAKFKDYTPYTCLEGKLSITQLKELTNNKLTDKQLQEVIENPKLLNEFGIDLNKLSSSIHLTPLKDVKFLDLGEKHWAYKYVKEASETGFVMGLPDGTFAPNQYLQAEDTFTFLNRVLVLNGKTQMKNSRSTVEKYITDKNWAFANVASIYSKLNENTIKNISSLEQQPITRDLLAQVLYEVTNGELKKVKDEQKFIDIDESKYKDAINYCVATGLLTGMSNDTMNPKKPVTRAELMAILIRLNEAIKN